MRKKQTNVFFSTFFKKYYFGGAGGGERNLSCEMKVFDFKFYCDKYIAIDINYLNNNKIKYDLIVVIL